MLEQIRLYLQGKKTYIVAALLVLSAIVGWLDGVSFMETIDQILIALGLGTIRSGITTEAVKVAGDGN